MRLFQKCNQAIANKMLGPIRYSGTHRRT